ncbi:MAG: hypothetical protein CMO81_02240 [Waddliaceae bacterium]|nr:hypothetical protein [Waddliaceae bacterium]
MINGVGLGFRRDLYKILLDSSSYRPSFIELAPENWMGLGGQWGKILKEAAELYPITCHGLSLSLGSPDPLDWDFLKQIKQFLKEYSIEIYSEHLSFNSCDNAHLYELFPLPFCDEAIKHVAERIRQVQDFLERKIAIENISYYTVIEPQMDEASFIRSIAEEADCQLLLDVNNVYVNAFNHQYNPYDFIEALPLERVAIMHMAGHKQKSEHLIIDTHGEAIIDPVFELLDWTCQRMSPTPVLLERDFNYPEYSELVTEMQTIEKILDRNWTLAHAS